MAFQLIENNLMVVGIATGSLLLTTSAYYFSQTNNQDIWIRNQSVLNTEETSSWKEDQVQDIIQRDSNFGGLM